MSRIVNKFLIGIDEAGRGPLAGPLAVGVFAVRNESILKKFRGVKDSKQLSAPQREEWFEKIKQFCADGDSFYAVSFARVETIDEKGLTLAVRMAINRSLRRLENKNRNCINGRILLDGLLKASSRYKDQETIIDGDAKEPIIALASICAKVVRDRYMMRLANEYPQYGFDRHKGYGTSDHYIALRKFGISPVHRRRFLTNFV